jgi:ferredoxin/coenzyme F420-reducing hydrogenase delta subunit
MRSFLRQRGLSGWGIAERGFDAAFGSALNPLRQLGAIASFSFVVLAISGALLYLWLDTSVAGAWNSIHSLDANLAGRWLRGTHRYAADTFVLATALHLLREWLHGHAGGFRRFSWLTGVPLLGLLAVSAIGGFWLNWDQLGQYSASATAEWLDALPLSPLALPVSRNFLAGAVSDRLFSLFIFVHIGSSLMLLFALWFHLQRIARPAVLPPRRMLAGLLLVLSALALSWPVASHAPAELATAPGVLRLDWLLLFVHPLAEATSPAFVWALLTGGTLLLFAWPYLPQQRRRAATAVVDAAHCNGCQRCLADCPYGAISLAPHPNPRIGRALAVVDADLCAGCGICAGACPSSTPSRARRGIPSGIDLPGRTIAMLHGQLRAALAACRCADPLVVFGCDHGAGAAAITAGDVCRVNLLCAGQLPPSFVDLALRDGAAGVLVASCRGCEFRFGARWLDERFAAVREPRLRAGAPGERIERVEAGPGDEHRIATALAHLRERVSRLPRETAHG